MKATLAHMCKTRNENKACNVQVRINQAAVDDEQLSKPKLEIASYVILSLLNEQTIYMIINVEFDVDTNIFVILAKVT